MTASLIKKTLTAISIIAVNLMSANLSFADTTSQNYSISLSVEPKCNVIAPSINFGTIYVTKNESAYEVTNHILLTCIKNTAYRIEIDAGNSISLDKGRKLYNKASNDYISYNLYTPDNQVWGNDFNGTTTYNGLGTGTQEQLLIKAKIFANQSVYPGSYIDTLIISVNY